MALPGGVIPGLADDGATLRPISIRLAAVHSGITLYQSDWHVALTQQSYGN
jgi:hypothetical protein